jgi:hypothetical protein
MQHPDRPAVTDGESAIAHLRQGVYAWMDADRVLPEEGAALLAALDAALLHLTAGDRSGATPGAAARTAVEQFIAGAQRFMEDEVLKEREGQGSLAATVALLAELPLMAG